MRLQSLFIAALSFAAPIAALAAGIIPPSVPAGLEPPAGAVAKWVLFGPQATLFDGEGQQIMTHFLSANPGEANTPARATWQHSNRTSAVWAVKVAESDDPRYVEAGAIKWFKLNVVGAQEGSRSPDRLTTTIVIQRVKTSGGVAPAAECTLASDVGKTKLVPYTADYVFYR
jgi:hypothetical protein